MRITFLRLRAPATALALAVAAALAPSAAARPNWCEMNRGVTGIVQRDLDHLKAATAKPGWQWADPAAQAAVAWIGTDLSTTINRLDRVTGGAAQGNIWVNDANPWDEEYSEYADLLRQLDGAIDGQADAGALGAIIGAVESRTRALAANCEGVPVPSDAGPVHPNPPYN